MSGTLRLNLIDLAQSSAERIDGFSREHQPVAVPSPVHGDN